MLTTVEKMLFLQRVPMFEGLSSRHLRVISDVAEEEQVSAQQLIFEEGQPGDKMYIVVEGQIQIEKAMAGGKSIILDTLEKRDLLGDMAILDDQPRSAAARTLVESRLLAVGSTAIHDLIREYPDIAFGLLKFCAQRIRESNRRLQAMGEAKEAAPGMPSAAPRLTVVAGPDAGRSYTVTTDVVKLGRSAGAEMEALGRLTVRDSAKQISRSHAEIYKDGGAFHVRDAGSVNGTFLNDRKVEGPLPLKSGDIIRLGSEAAIRFEI